MTASIETLPSSSRYRIASCIASGGMASVYIGIQRGAAGFKRPVAIKRAHPYLLEDPAFRDTILREARNASAVRHPNVVSVDDVEESDGELLLVMDYVEGTSLSHVLASRTALSAPVAVRIVMDMCAALNAIHVARNEEGVMLGLVHRDVSPQNILIDTDGIARLTDFGIAKGDAESKGPTDHARVGKFGYMAPEYLRGSVFSPRSDIFALGVVLWEAVAGRSLFKGTSPSDSLRLTLQGRIPPASSFHPDVPPSLEVVLRKCLAVRPADRYQTMRELHEALEGCLLRVATREDVADVVIGVAGTMLDEHRRAINLARLSARPPCELALASIDDESFVPREADIFGARTEELDEPELFGDEMGETFAETLVCSDTLRPETTPSGRARKFELDLGIDDGLVPSSRFAMPERVSIVLPAEPRSKAMIALGIALVALVVMSTTFIIQLGTGDDVTTSQVR